MFHFWNLHQTSNILKKKMVVITTLFQKLQTVKDFIRLLKFKCNYLSNQKPCPFFLFHFWNLHRILNMLKRKWSSSLLLFGNCRLSKTCFEHSLKKTVSEHSQNTFFWKLQTAKNLLKPLSKKHRFRTLFDSHNVKVSHILVWELIVRIFLPD